MRGHRACWSPAPLRPALARNSAGNRATIVGCDRPRPFACAPDRSRGTVDIVSRKAESKPRFELKLELDAPASPALVARIARMFQEALEATGVAMDDESVTMVVGNLKASATLRGRDECGEQVVRTIHRVVENPVKTLQENPSARFVAEALAQHATSLRKVGGRFKVGRRVVARFDETLIGALRGASVEVPAGIVLHGGDQVYSRVLRVGRVDEGGALKARVLINGRPLEIDVSESARESFFDAAKSEVPQRIDLHTEWLRAPDGSLHMNARRSCAVATSDSRAVSGEDFVDRLAGSLDAEAVGAFLRESEARR